VREDRTDEGQGSPKWFRPLRELRTTVGKKNPFTLDRFDGFFNLLPERAESDRSRVVTRQVIEERNYDLKAVNPRAKREEDLRTPEELMDIIEAKGREVAEAIAELRRLTRPAEEGPRSLAMPDGTPPVGPRKE